MEMQQHLWSIDMLFGFYLLSHADSSRSSGKSLETSAPAVPWSNAGNELMLIDYVVSDWQLIQACTDPVFLQKIIIKSLKCYKRYPNSSLSGFFWVHFFCFLRRLRNPIDIFFARMRTVIDYCLAFSAFSLFTCVVPVAWTEIFCSALPFIPTPFWPQQMLCSIVRFGGQFVRFIGRMCQRVLYFIQPFFLRARVCMVQLWYPFKFNYFQCMANVRSSVRLSTRKMKFA